MASHEHRPKLSRIVRKAVVIIVIAVMVYASASGLITAISRHGQPDLGPRHWPWKSQLPSGIQAVTCAGGVSCVG